MVAYLLVDNTLLIKLKMTTSHLLGPHRMPNGPSRLKSSPSRL